MVFRTHFSAKFVVIGSGAGGATAFHTLVRRGVEPLLIEEGPTIAESYYSRPVDEVTLATYRNGGLLPIFGKPLVPYAEGRLLGGTTELNGALIWRTPEFVRSRWIREHQLGPVFGETLDSHFEFVESRLSVTRASLKPNSNRDSELLSRGARTLGWNVLEVPRAAPNCEHSNRCGSGCPAGAKNTMSRTLIKDGIAGGGKVITDLKVTEIRKNGTQGFELKCVNQRTYEAIDVSAEKVIVAGGAVQTPHLLFKSGLGGRMSPLCFHVNLKVLAEFDEKVSAVHGTIFTHQVQEFIDDGQLIMATNFRSEYLAMAFSWLGIRELEHLARVSEHLGLFTVQVAPKSRGRIMVVGDQSYVFHNMNTTDLNLLTSGIKRCALALFTAGAKRLQLPIGDSRPAMSMSDVEAIVDQCDVSDLMMSSVHLMASKPMSVNVGSNVCGIDGEIYGSRGIYVVDASLLPGWTVESPQGTIMAVARHITEQIDIH